MRESNKLVVGRSENFHSLRLSYDTETTIDVTTSSTDKNTEEVSLKYTVVIK